MNANILDVIDQSFAHLPDFDTRAKVGLKTFLVTLVFGLIVDASSRSLEGLRRFLVAQTGTALARSTFWGRLAAKRFRKNLFQVASSLMRNLAAFHGVNLDLATKLGVQRILALDSSSISLPKAAAGLYPAPRKNVIPAAFKWSLCADLLAGNFLWWKMTDAATHDRKSFPPLDVLKGALLIFDLGYWDYSMMNELIQQGAFFLSRVKSNAVVEIVEVISGMPKRAYQHTHLFDHSHIVRGQTIIEFIGSFGSQANSGALVARVIGFWNKHDKCYHWYTTNLKVPASWLYPLYRLRWQIELIFKSEKSSLNLADSPSANPCIIESLLLLAIIAGMLAQALGKDAASKSSDDQKMALSVQRSAMILVQISVDMKNFILRTIIQARTTLERKLLVMAKEFIDPNYRHRETSLARLARLAAQDS